MRIIGKHHQLVNSVAISSDDQFIVSGSNDETVRLWNIKTGENHIIGEHDHCVTSVAISSDNQFIISGSHDETVRLWNI